MKKFFISIMAVLFCLSFSSCTKDEPEVDVPTYKKVDKFYNVKFNTEGISWVKVEDELVEGSVELKAGMYTVTYGVSAICDPRTVTVLSSSSLNKILNDEDWSKYSFTIDVSEDGVFSFDADEFPTTTVTFNCPYAENLYIERVDGYVIPSPQFGKPITFHQGWTCTYTVKFKIPFLPALEPYTINEGLYCSYSLVYDRPYDENIPGYYTMVYLNSFDVHPSTKNGSLSWHIVKP